MVTQIVSIGLYCPQTGETRTSQLWFHGSPFDAAEDITARLWDALMLTPEDRYEVVETRQSRNPDVPRWDQLALDVDPSR